MNKKYKILIATGGTGGHVIPAYNLGKHLLKKKMKVELISDKRGLKYLVNESNIKVNIIPSSTLFKKNYLKIILSILTIFFSLIMSKPALQLCNVFIALLISPSEINAIAFIPSSVILIFSFFEIKEICVFMSL